MNRFICPELEANTQNAINFGLFKRTKENADSLIIDGVNMPQYDSTIDKRTAVKSSYYQYGTTELSELFEFRSFDVTERTVSELATARGIAINTNFGTFTKDFIFYYNRLLDLRTNMWYTVFDSNGELYFLKPERDSNSSEITNFDVLLKTNATDQSVKYEGESGADFTVAVDTKCVVPVLVDDDIKQMTVNKYNANLNHLTIQARVDVNVLDYVIENGDVYVILSKKLISGDNEIANYECRAVKEVADSLSFSGADVDYPTSHLNSIIWNGYRFNTGGLVDDDLLKVNVTNGLIERVVPDTWHYVGTGGEPSFLNSWVNLGGVETHLRFTIDRNGYVHIEGYIKNGTSGKVFVLPSGYRPDDNVRTSQWGQNAATAPAMVFAVGFVDSNGDVWAYGDGGSGSPNDRHSFDFAFKAA